MKILSLAPVLSLAAVFAASTNLVSAADWPQWRGPNRDGKAPGTESITSLPAQPKTLWKINTGPGHASVIIAGKYLAYVDEQGGNEAVHLCDAATGKEIWRQMCGKLADYYNYGTGPRTTPLFDGDRLYTQSGRGEFTCFSVADGKKLWRKNFETDYGATWFGNKSGDPAAKETASRRHGNNGAPVIDGDRIFVPVGSPNGATLVAFDKKTGKELWKVGNDNTAYSSLMVATLAGTRQVVHLTADALMGVDCATGSMLWRTPVKTGAKRHVFTPIIDGDTVTISSTSVGMTRFHVARTGETFSLTPDWVCNDVKITISSSVQVGDKIYGIGTSKGQSQSDYVCVDAKTGKLLWSKSGFGDYASTTAIGDKLLVLNSTGEMFLLAANPTAYKEISRIQPCGKTYSHPAVVDGKLFVRDEKNIYALGIK